MRAIGRGDGPHFEDWLDKELKRTLGPVTGPRVRAVQASYRSARHAERQPLRLAVKSGIAAALTSKAAAGAVVVALAAGGGGAAAAAATGSANPVDWAPAVVHVVQDCADDVHVPGAGTGYGNVGQCVSTVARQHSQQKPAAPASRVRQSGPAPSPSPLAGKAGDRGALLPASGPRLESPPPAVQGGSPATTPSPEPTVQPSPIPSPSPSPAPSAPTPSPGS